MPGDTPTLSKTELFTRLAEGQAAGVTVVTPNRRLAQVLKSEFDSFQTHNGLPAWEDADILPLEAFAARRYEDSLYAEGGGELPVLITEAQALLLWEEAISASKWAGALLDIPQTAARAMDAWRLARVWGMTGKDLAGGLEKFAVNEDTRAFADWAGAYARRLKRDNLVDATLLFGFDFALPKPKLLVAYAFDVMPVTVKTFLEGFPLAICGPEKRAGHAGRTSFASPRDELEAAAKWARARLEEGKSRIGVVVPDLALRRREVVRVFARVMGSSQCFNLSIGEPLSGFPVVAAALSLIEFSLRELPLEAASRLIRSPFLGGAETAMAARARFDAKLREEAGATITLPKLISVADGSLRVLLEKIYGKASNSHSPDDWARHFTAVLEAADFPGERALDSAEYQARAKFNEMLGELARLSLIASRFSGPQALARLKRLCAETLFQPEGAGGDMLAPVQVLGLLESAGIAFDALWVSGLTDGQWPLRAHPDPFLPVALQKRAGIPEASAEASLELDRRRTLGWLSSAAEVVFSWPRREEDRDLLPSPLIAGIPEREIAQPAALSTYPSHRDLVFQARRTETWTDETGPALIDATVRGGTRVLADQAACPFRAYARHRLRARELDAPEDGLDAMQRGILIHRLMEEIWKEAKTSAALDTDLGPVIRRAAAAAVAELKIEGRFAELERARLARIAGEWLVEERKRKPFEVVATEEEALRPVGALMLKGRIDRMDRLVDGDLRGTHVLIDYKTGSSASPRMWRGARPDEPQLPFYAVTGGEEVKAVAFAKVRPGQMRFMGYAKDKAALPGMTAFNDWRELLAEWRGSLTGLADGFASGRASVDPKYQLKTCANCDLHTLCRVHEKLNALEENEEWLSALEENGENGG